MLVSFGELYSSKKLASLGFSDRERQTLVRNTIVDKIELPNALLVPVVHIEKKTKSELQWLNEKADELLTGKFYIVTRCRKIKKNEYNQFNSLVDMSVSV